jgi:transcriptional regulator with XRE-family HTH domain
MRNILNAMNNPLSAFIEEMCARKHLTMREVVRRAVAAGFDLNIGTLSRIRSGEDNVTVLTLKGIAAGLGVPPGMVGIAACSPQPLVESDDLEALAISRCLPIRAREDWTAIGLLLFDRHGDVGSPDAVKLVTLKEQDEHQAKSARQRRSKVKTRA